MTNVARMRDLLLVDFSSEASSDRAAMGLLTACLGPFAFYVVIYGESIHFILLFVLIVFARIWMNIDLFSHLKTSQGLVPASSTSTLSSGVNRIPRPVSSRMPSSQGRKTSNNSKAALSSGPSLRVSPTVLVSSECSKTKTRRGIVNKVSPDKLEELTAKLVQTFDLSLSPDQIEAEFTELLCLVFAAASRQPQYLSVFVELVAKVARETLEKGRGEILLTKESQEQWSSICLGPVEEVHGWDDLTDEDKADTRTRHRGKQLAIAEFCGLLASHSLIPPSSPLEWVEVLLEYMMADLDSSQTESYVELICWVIRGLGMSEELGLFTELDQTRFEAVCERLFSVPISSSRIKCVLQDLRDLRDSNWSKLPNWKLALMPGKRVSKST
jgi:hypothetical protein